MIYRWILLLFVLSCQSPPTYSNLANANFGDTPVDYHAKIEQHYTDCGTAKPFDLLIGYPQKSWWHYREHIIYGYEVPVEVFVEEQWISKDYHQFSNYHYYGIKE